MKLIRVYQAQGHIKHCVHVRPEIVETNRDGSRFWGVRCAQDSFNIQRPLDGSYLSHFFGCPSDCHYLQSPARARLQQLRGIPRQLLAWFNVQPWQVKVAVFVVIAVMVLMWRGAETIRALAELVKVMWGK